jgi:hypothetical protein
MPRDLIWTLENGSKGGKYNGQPLSSYGLRRALKALHKHIRLNGGIVKLITKYDMNGTGEFSDANFKLLLLVRQVRALFLPPLFSVS